MKFFRIRKSYLRCFLLLLPFFQPQYFKTIGLINNIYRLATYGVLAYIFVLAFIGKKKLSASVVTIILLESWMALITYLERGNINSAVSNVIMFAGLGLVLDLYRERFNIVLKCLLVHFELCIYINLATILFLPNGLYTIDNGVYRIAAGYFLGWHHLFLIWEFPALIVSWIHKEIFRTSKRCFLLCAAIILCELPYGGSTGLAGVVIFIILNLIPFIKNIMTPYKGVFAAALVMVFIIFIRQYDFLEPIIVGVLNGDMTFTGRLVIWDNAIQAILKRPIWGYGILTQERAVSMLGFGAATHCHDQILQILLQGGIIGIALFIFLYYLDITKCKKNWNSKIAQICTYGIIVFTIIGITEPFEYVLMYIIFMLPYYLEKMIMMQEQKINYRG